MWGSLGNTLQMQEPSYRKDKLEQLLQNGRAAKDGRRLYGLQAMY